jgi:hypothetical protein
MPRISLEYSVVDHCRSDAAPSPDKINLKNSPSFRWTSLVLMKLNIKPETEFLVLQMPIWLDQRSHTVISSCLGDGRTLANTTVRSICTSFGELWRSTGRRMAGKYPTKAAQLTRVRRGDTGQRLSPQFPP